MYRQPEREGERERETERGTEGRKDRHIDSKYRVTDGSRTVFKKKYSVDF